MIHDIVGHIIILYKVPYIEHHVVRYIYIAKVVVAQCPKVVNIFSPNKNAYRFEIIYEYYNLHVYKHVSNFIYTYELRVTAAVVYVVLNTSYIPKT